MLRLRPYKACDAQTITKWLKSENVEKDMEKKCFP